MIGGRQSNGPIKCYEGDVKYDSSYVKKDLSSAEPRSELMRMF